MYNLRIISRENKLVLRKSKTSVRILKKTQKKVNIQAKAKRGLQGEPGKIQELTAGPGIVVDNTDPANPVISASPGLGGDLNYTADFTNQTSYTVNHNLGKYPAVTVIDSAGDEVIGDVEYLDLNTLRVVFSAPLSGRVTCN